METAGTSREQDEFPFLSTPPLLAAVVGLVVLVEEVFVMAATAAVKEPQSTRRRHIQRTRDIAT